MKFTTALASATILAASMFGVASAADMTVGFSQIGSESGWRAAETTLTKQQAEKRGIDLKFADAQQKQENQIKALRSFIAQGVDAILVAPVVATNQTFAEWSAVFDATDPSTEEETAATVYGVFSSGLESLKSMVCDRKEYMGRE